MPAKKIADLFLHTKRLLEVAAEIIKTLPQNISISGHTDSTRFGGGSDYSNWELSADRANSARRWLMQIGITEDRFDRVVGKAATEAARAEGPARKLVTLTIETDMDVTLDEAILKDGEAIGYISSGGYAHHVGRSMAMGYVATAHSKIGTPLWGEVRGKRLPLSVAKLPFVAANFKR